MNEQTIKLIEQLAQKLGTTSEYLWMVLVKSAPFSAAISCVYIIVCAIFGIVLYRLHRKFSIGKAVDDHPQSYKYNRYHYDEWLGTMMVISAIIWGIFVIICFFQISNIISGFFNPEYWALKRIFSLIS